MQGHDIPFLSSISFRFLSTVFFQLEIEEKNKFSLIRSGQEQQVKLKAESQADAEEWMQNLSTAIKLVIVHPLSVSISRF